ncbi:MAG: T9SS type A sorting domain-containing protein [Bacteroidales bacterium]|nr:T9SS type A sorting domain-containing protein [Bacteroidales bacterium]
MKHKILLLSIIGVHLLLWKINLQAQGYLALPDSNATWIVTDLCSVGTFHIEYGLSTNRNDTVINSNIYHKIFLKDMLKNIEYAGAYRSDTNGKTYYVPAISNDSTEYLWYDFTKNTGDTIKDIALNDLYYSFIGTYDLVVDSVNYKDSGPYQLKCLFLSIIPPGPQGYNGLPIIWVERIGSLNGGIFNQYRCGLNMLMLRCMNADDTIFYFSPFELCFLFQGIVLSYEPGICELPISINETVSEHKQICVYPNPVDDRIMIKNLPSEPIEISIFNTMGQKVFNKRNVSSERNHITIISNLKPGLYYIRIISINNELLTKKIIKR